MDDLSRLDAVATAALISTNQISPIEAVDAAIARIDKLDPELNAIVVPLFDEARAAALDPHLPDGPFRGVPIVLKDLGAQQAGVPQYQGNRILKELDWRPTQSSPMGKRITKAGFIVLGKGATPEFGAQPTTSPKAFAPTRNPWDTARSTSGSSGGSAAAVASGMVAVAHASDGGGSIRMPAAWCGLVGLKPSRGRTSRGAIIGRLGAEHVVSHTVRDTAAILDALHGPELGDLYLARPPARPYIEEVGSDAGRLRIGILTSVEATEVDEEVVQATQRTAKLLESLGHHVEESGPSMLFNEELLSRAELDYACNMRTTAEGLWASLGRELREEDIEPYSWARMQRIEGVTAVEHIKAAAWLQRYASRIVSWWRDFDLLLTPTTGEVPALLEELIPPADDPWSIDIRYRKVRCFARPFNITGQPAISLPLQRSLGGLPIGVQLVADLGAEDLLIRVSAQLEEAAPWDGHRPTVSA
ncbi:MAG: amidase [Actinomycetota bacterium]